MLIVHLVMSSRTISITEAVNLVSDRESRQYLINALFLTKNLPGVPLFSVTDYFKKQLELYEACNYQPTKGHPLVEAWIKE